MAGEGGEASAGNGDACGGAQEHQRAWLRGDDSGEAASGKWGCGDVVARAGARGRAEEMGSSQGAVGHGAAVLEVGDGDAVDDEEEGEAAPASGLRRRDPVREGPAGWLQRWLGSSRGRGDMGFVPPDPESGWGKAERGEVSRRGGEAKALRVVRPRAAAVASGERRHVGLGLGLCCVKYHVERQDVGCAIMIY